MMEPPKRQKGGRDGRGKGGTAGRRRRQFAVKRGERRQRGSAPHHRTKLLFYVKLVQQQPLMALKCFLAHGGGMSASAVQRVKPRCRLYAQKKNKKHCEIRSISLDRRATASKKNEGGPKEPGGCTTSQSAA